MLELEGVAARGWPATHVAEVDGWLLRATDGAFTARANSAVPLTETAVESVAYELGRDHGIPGVVQAIDGWYRDRSLPPRLALPVPLMDTLRARLAAHGWRGRGPTLVMTATVSAVLAACGERADLPAPQVADHLDATWLRGYERGHEVTDARRRAILEGGGARFATLHLDDEVAGIVRTTVHGPWVGIAPVEVAPAHRRRGLARHLLGWALRDGAARGADRVWLQVEASNAPALALYRQLGFEEHHAYWYDTPADQGADT